MVRRFLATEAAGGIILLAAGVLALPGSLQDAAKIGVLAASTLAAIAGALTLRRGCRTVQATET